LAIDTLIRGARVVDGTGNPWFYGDVALARGRVAEVASPDSMPEEAAAEVVDAAGMAVCPGFIDIQSHSIIPLMIDHRCLSKITQGVTTEIMGEAWTPSPAGGRREETVDPMAGPIDILEWSERARDWKRFGDWLEAMVKRGVSPNVGSFLGGGSLREYGRGMDMGRSSAGEMATMLRVMEQAMEDGAFGISYALIYSPDAYADTDEVVEVCRAVARHGGVYITHMRSEGEHLLQGVEEAIEIGLRAEIPVEIYHLKASGRGNWHKMPTVIDMIDKARASGVDITADMYPYVGSGTGLSSLLPPSLSEGGRFYENLRNPKMRESIRKQVLEPSGDWEAMGTDTGPEGVMPVGFELPEHRKYVGKRLSEIAEMRGQDWVDATIDLLAAEEQRIFTIYFSMVEENLRLQLKQPWIKISTDAGGVDPVWATRLGPTHPRAYGTYPRVLGKYVREEKVITLEDAIRKMTSSVADRIGLRERGLLSPGYWADVVMFDPETIGDRATFEDTHQLSTGIRDVWVNGVRVLENGEHTGEKAGVFVRGPGAR
jgi:N-acyl-D-amino-acid deacylase